MEALQCIMCDQWCHKGCGKITAELFRICDLQKKECGTAYWVCTSCSSFAAKMSIQMKEMDKKISKIEKTVKSNSDNIATLNKASDTVNDKLKSLEKSQDELKDNNRHNQEGTARVVLAELRQQESKKDNLVVHMIKESTSDNLEERKEDDRSEIDDLFTELELDISSEDVKFIKRLGRRTQDTVRPILLGLKTHSDKEKIMSRANTLKDKEDPWNEIYISPDLTYQQRKEDERVRAECEQKNLERSEEDSLNFEFRVVGRKGQKILVKTSLRESSQRATQGPAPRGRGRGRPRRPR